MTNINRQRTAPISVPRTRRPHNTQLMTSFKAGVIAPVAMIPLLREDSAHGRVSARVEMAETHELLVNPVDLRCTIYLVPWLAMERFEGSRDQFDRSFMGEGKTDGGSVVPFIDTLAAGTHGGNAIRKTLGLHAKSTDVTNTMDIEGYNVLVNYRKRNRSKELAQRARLTTSLAPAFWLHSQFAHILPDFDQAVIDGEVALNMVIGDLALSAATAPVTGTVSIADSGNSLRLGQGASKANPRGFAMDTSTAGAPKWDSAAASNSSDLRYERGLAATHTLQANLAGIVAELQAGGVTMSLSNLELARKTVAMAKTREQFEGIEEEHIIDMLMNALVIPDQMWKQPILLADQTVQFGQMKRYATDAENLAESAVSGGAVINIGFHVPRVNVGGMVYVCLEAVPRQMFERRRDPFLYARNERDNGDLVDFPAYQRDYLDPEKVDVVTNGEIDVAHATPADPFGYGPLNWDWAQSYSRAGGKFFRPTTDLTEDVERRRFWAVERLNPTLAEDFYEVSAIHQKPFLDTTADPFEAAVETVVVIEGNTVFGGRLAEATGNYDKVLAKAPQERIDQTP